MPSTCHLKRIDSQEDERVYIHVSTGNSKVGIICPLPDPTVRVAASADDLKEIVGGALQRERSGRSLQSKGSHSWRDVGLRNRL